MEARVIIEEGYQRLPSFDDRIEVKGKLFLPTKDGFLDPKIRFYTYIFICGEALRDCWGQYDPAHKMRFKTLIGRGFTFEEAKRDLFGFVNLELNKLKEALLKRREVLKFAGKFEPKEIDYQLPISSAKILIEKIRQNEPGIDDNLVVSGRILLPTNGKKRLIEEFQFGGRLSICEDILHPSWGQYDGKRKMRYMKISATGTTCKEAVKNLEKVAFEELEKLRNMLKERKEVLENAGQFEKIEKRIKL